VGVPVGVCEGVSEEVGELGRVDVDVGAAEALTRAVQLPLAEAVPEGEPVASLLPEPLIEAVCDEDTDIEAEPLAAVDGVLFPV